MAASSQTSGWLQERAQEGGREGCSGEGRLCAARNNEKGAGRFEARAMRVLTSPFVTGLVPGRETSPPSPPKPERNWPSSWVSHWETLQERQPVTPPCNQPQQKGGGSETRLQKSGTFAAAGRGERLTS